MRLLVHGGAGPIPRDAETAALEPRYRSALAEAVESGVAVMRAGGTALDAVTEAVVVLEDCPLFNAGRGSVLNNDGRVEMDAAVMCGRTLAAGAVACVSGIRNPVRAARAVMAHSQHVLLVGAGAQAFAADHGCAREAENYFIVPQRLERWRALQETGRVELDLAMPGGAAPGAGEYGTVGAVALDDHGHLAAATSTGGLTNKRWGRVGDSPLIGAGTYASDDSVAVSLTGVGEHIIRTVAAHALAAAVEIGGVGLRAATGQVLARLERIGGRAGLIAIDRHGDYVLAMNTTGMARGWVDADGQIYTALYA